MISQRNFSYSFWLKPILHILFHLTFSIHLNAIWILEHDIFPHQTNSGFWFPRKIRVDAWIGSATLAFFLTYWYTKIEYLIHWLTGKTENYYIPIFLMGTFLSSPYAGIRVKLRFCFYPLKSLRFSFLLKTYFLGD